MFVQFTSLPNQRATFIELMEAHKKSPHHMAALLLAALRIYPADNALALELIGMLKGEGDLTQEERDFIKISMMGNEYLPDSYMDGATPLNNYTPRFPFTISFTDTLEQPQPGYLTVFARTSGAEYPRAVTLKEIDGGWYPSDWSELLMSIRPPAHGTRADHPTD